MIRCQPRLYAPAGGSKRCTMDNMCGSECSFTCQLGHIMRGSANLEVVKKIRRVLSASGLEMKRSVNVSYTNFNLIYLLPRTVQRLVMTGPTEDSVLVTKEILLNHCLLFVTWVCGASGTWSPATLWPDCSSN